MIKHPYVDGTQGIDQSIGDLPVGLAGFGDAAGVVVRQDGRCGVVFQGGADDFSRVDGGAVDGAVEQGFVGQYPVLVVEPDGREDFVLEPAHLGQQESAGVAGRGQGRTGLQFVEQVAAAHFQHGLQLDVFGHAQPLAVAELGLLG